MTHIDEDKLLEYALEIIDSDIERSNIADHLKACPECSALLENIQGDIEIIGNVQPSRHLSQISNPMARRVTKYTILKAAALIIFGIFVGYGASEYKHREPMLVSPAYVTLSPPDDAVGGYVASDATEISERYYEYILEGQK